MRASPRIVWTALTALVGLLLLAAAPAARANEAAEYRLKAAFVYNFLNFVEWAPTAEPVFNLCIVGNDPFGAEIDGLAGKAVGTRRIELVRKSGTDGVRACHAVFVAAAPADRLGRTLEALRGAPVLTIADSADAARQGAMLGLRVANSRIVFDANVQAARAAGLTISSRLLRLASEVIQ